MNKLPTIQTTNYVSSAYTRAQAFGGGAQAGWVQQGLNNFQVGNGIANQQNMNAYVNAIGGVNQLPIRKEEPMAESKRRLVKVIIIDPDENVPLYSALLYSGEEKFTDLTDQELFFEIDIKTVLADHNEKRVTIRDKKVKERDAFLEPARIRDLRMTVVNVATF